MTSQVSRLSVRFLVLSVLAIVAVASYSRQSRAAEAAPQPVTTIDQIQFQQTNAQAQMDELQKRMSRLADLTREAEPDDAAKLLLAVRAAREQFILEQMRDNLNLLNSKDFTNAAEDQTKIIAKLEELKKLLTSGVSDLQMLLEKLRAIDQSIKKLDAATTEEKRQTDASAKLAEAKPADPKPLDNLKQDQQQNRKATESIAQAVKNLGGSAAKAGETLGTASQSMSMAEGALGSGKPSDAQVQQTTAVANMQQAKKELNEEREKVMMEVEKLVRKQIVMNLTEMLDRQKSVRAGTEMAVERLGGPQQRETLAKIRQLGNSETAIVRIADQTIELINTTGFSVALPPALKRVQLKMAVIAATLDDSRADATLIKSEIQVEKDLQDLLDTFKELSAAKVTPGSCKGCKGDHNKLEAELKVIRMMQMRINDDTKGVDGERGTQVAAADIPANINPLLRDKILSVRDGQGDVKAALDKIHEQLSAPDEPAAEEQPK